MRGSEESAGNFADAAMGAAKNVVEVDYATLLPARCAYFRVCPIWRLCLYISWGRLSLVVVSTCPPIRLHPHSAAEDSNELALFAT